MEQYSQIFPLIPVSTPPTPFHTYLRMKRFSLFISEAKHTNPHKPVPRGKLVLGKPGKPLQWKRVYRASRPNDGTTVAGVWKSTNRRFTITQNKYPDWDRNNPKGWIWRYELSDSLLGTEFNGPLTLKDAKDMAQNDSNIKGWSG